MRRLRLLVPVLLLSLTGAACSDDPRPAAAPSPSAVAPPAASPAAPLTGPSATTVPSPAASPSPAAVVVRLTGDGIEAGGTLIAFGDAFDVAEPALRAALGEPTLDTGERKPFGRYGTCPGTRLRGLEYGGGALSVLFGDVIGPGMTMYHWVLSERGDPAEVPRASALVGGTTTFEFGVGDTLAALRAGTRGATLDVREGDEVTPPTFRLNDQSAGFFGFLTGTQDTSRITGVQAGEPCGE